MKRLALTAFLALVLLSVAIAVVAVVRAPRVVSFSPGENAVVPTGGAEVQIAFSRRVSVQDVLSRVKIAPAVLGKWRVDGKVAIFTPSTPWQGGQTVVVEVRPPRGLGGIPLGPSKQWQFRIGDPVVAYITPTTGMGDIFTINPKNGKITPLTTSTRVLDFSPSFDGRYIYFSQQNFQHGSDLWRIDRLQKGTPSPTLLLKCDDMQCTSPLPDPTGGYLAYLRNDGMLGGTRVHVLNLKTNRDQALSSENSTSLLPQWSSSGALAYYDQMRHGYVIWRPDKGEVGFVSNDTAEDDAWSPDGHNLLVVTFILEGKNSDEAPSKAPYFSAHLMLYRLWPEPASVDLTRDPEIEDATPSFSPDGKWIACGRKFLDSKRWTLGRQFWLIKPDGSDARQITNSPTYNHLDFSWRPDSQVVVYVRTNMSLLTEPPEIWLYNLKTGTLRLLVKGGVMPKWLP